MESVTITKGFAIAVLDRGFVYVGDVEVDSTWCIIRNARNVRIWGTTKGLGELANSGPTPKTILDDTGTIRAPIRSLIFLIETEPNKWKK